MSGMTNAQVLLAQVEIVGICQKTIRENALIHFGVIRPSLRIMEKALQVIISARPHAQMAGDTRRMLDLLINDLNGLRKALEFVMDKPIDDFHTVSQMFDKIIAMITPPEPPTT